MLCLCGCEYPEHANDCPGPFYMGTVEDVIRWERAQRNKRMMMEQREIETRTAGRTA